MVLMGQLALVLLVCFFIDSQKGSFGFSDLVVLLISWLVSVSFTHKHKPKLYQKKIKYIAAPYFRAVLIMMLAIVFFRGILGLGRADAKDLLAVTFAYAVIEGTLLLAWCRVVVREGERTPGDVLQTLWAIRKHAQAHLSNLEGPDSAKPVDMDLLLETAGSFDKGELAKLIIEYIPRGGPEPGRGTVHDAPESVGGEESGLSLILCTRSLNNMICPNRYLASCYRQLLPGGWLVLRYTDIDKAEEALRKRYPKPSFYPVRALQFLLHQCLPKIPHMEGVYLALARGQNRAISRVEAWGRLSYSGLDVIAEKDARSENYLLARKTKTPSDNPNPSWYPVITLDRVGLHGEIIKIHKIRTMYPYSEFLQQRVFEENRLSATGKFNDDYRITRVGRIFRKYFLDELPQLLDWTRGEIKLVGIRAMSLHFFSLYPQEYQDLFLRVKPGILSPVFDEGTTDFNRIVETESHYLKSYVENPILTDIIYFFKAIHQIVFQGMRSK